MLDSLPNCLAFLRHHIKNDSKTTTMPEDYEQKAKWASYSPFHVVSRMTFHDVSRMTGSNLQLCGPPSRFVCPIVLLRILLSRQNVWTSPWRTRILYRRLKPKENPTRMTCAEPQAYRAVHLTKLVLYNRTVRLHTHFGFGSP